MFATILLYCLLQGCIVAPEETMPLVKWVGKVNGEEEMELFFLEKRKESNFVFS